MSFYQKVVALCSEKGISRSKMADDIGISRSVPIKWENSNSIPRASTIKKIADYFGVTVEYLKSEDDNVTVHTVNDNHGVIGNANAPVTIINGSEHKLTEQEIELLNTFDALSVVDKAKVIIYASELAQK